MIKIVSVGWNCVKYINKCIESIKSQTYTNWECCIILDPSSDGTYEKAMEYGNEKFKIYQNKYKRYAIGNISFAIKMLDPSDDDIIIWLDTDDWLANKDSLSTLMNYYENDKNLLVTHGSWKAYPQNGANTNNAPYTKYDFQKGIRDLSMGAWRGSHLKTMKYKVYKEINQDREFKWSNGNWLESAYDLSIMYPALEMAGFNRVKFISEILYIYNRETKYNDDKINGSMQAKCANYLAKLSRYKELKNV